MIGLGLGTYQCFNFHTFLLRVRISIHIHTGVKNEEQILIQQICNDENYTMHIFFDFNMAISKQYTVRQPCVFVYVSV